MAIHKLTDLQVESKLKKARANKGKTALIGDGMGLYLAVAKGGSASWLYRYMIDGNAKSVGLGGYPAVPLKLARELAQKYREAKATDIDPQVKKRQVKAEVRAARTQSKTFGDCAHDYIELNRSTWKNSKHAQQWSNTLKQYAFPTIANLPVSEVSTEHIVEILSPIWNDKRETATRLRGRIETILDWATVAQLRNGENPARLKGHLEHLLPKIGKVKRQHFKSLPYAQLPQFMQALGSEDGMARYALEFLILTATRTNEVIGAQWTEINFEQCMWTIPAERMKAQKLHRIPLSARCIKLLELVKPFSGKRYIFTSFSSSGKSEKPISNMAMSMLLRRMQYKNITVHGMRSTFRDWAGEQTSYPFEVCEHALAHKLPDEVSAAYLRSDFFEKRVQLMADWSNFCFKKFVL